MKPPTLELVAARILVCLCLAVGRAALAGEQKYAPFEGAKSAWHDGFERYDFVMDAKTMAITPLDRPADEKFGIGAPRAGDRRCVVVCPKQPAPGNPWSWQGCYWDHQPQTEVELLRRGFHIAYISADGSLKPDEHWEAWYAYLTQQHGLSKKPAFVGMSRGGEYALTWAARHPDQVACIYGDNPGCNEEAMGKLGELARNDVPIMLVCGTIDPILDKYGLMIEKIYQQYGGRVSMILKEGAGHHPHSLIDPKPMADFIERSVRETAPATPDFVGSNRFVRRAYYSAADIYEKSAGREGYYLTRRGPAFVESYDRYDVSLGFAAPVTIVAPRKDAAGRPWVFRAGYVGRDAAVDQALLAKGFHIVVGPVGFNADGPSRAEWDKLYGYLTDHGFSKKPVMEGAGGAAGAVYAWAIANPDKVACVYAENPILRAWGVKTQPLNDLAPLAKAGVRLLHVCGSLDPALEEQTRVAERRYGELGGKMTVIVREGRGHVALDEAQEVKAVVEFILGRL
jgi:pimeloyl-ACP methyl ester carboxylesterase